MVLIDREIGMHQVIYLRMGYNHIYKKLIGMLAIIFLKGCLFPGFIGSAKGCNLTSLDMLTIIPAYCRNSESPYEINVIKKFIQLQYYSPRGRPPYSFSIHHQFSISILENISPST